MENVLNLPPQSVAFYYLESERLGAYYGLTCAFVGSADAIKAFAATCWQMGYLVREICDEQYYAVTDHERGETMFENEDLLVIASIEVTEKA